MVRWCGSEGVTRRRRRRRAGRQGGGKPLDFCRSPDAITRRPWRSNVGSGGKRAAQERRQLLLSRPQRSWRIRIAAENLAAKLVVGDGGVEEDEAEQVHERVPHPHVPD